MGGLLAALGIGGTTAAGATAAGTGLGISSLPAAMAGAAGTGALTGAATSAIPSVLSAGSAAGGGMLANALKGINSLEQQPAVQLAQKLRPFMQSTPAPTLSPMGGGGGQVIQRKRTKMFE